MRTSGAFRYIRLLCQSLQDEADATKQRIRCCFELADHRPDAATFHQPATRAGFPHSTGALEDAGKLARTAHRDHTAQFAELAWADAMGQGRRWRVHRLSPSARKRLGTAWWNGHGLPARDGAGALACLRIVEHAREQTAQLDRGGELAALFKDGADRSSLCLSDNEHAGRMGRRAVDDKHQRRPREPALPVLASPGRACRRLVQVAIPGPRRPPMARPLSTDRCRGSAA